MADVDEVREINAAFYAAFESGDLDAMLSVWLDRADTSCVHPGALPVRGTSAIRRTWALVMAHTPYIQFFLTDVDVSVDGDAATVTCTENVLTGDDDPGVFGGAKAVATNVFLRTTNGWRMWIHHASPVMSGGPDDA